jgi:hypothetical protein
MIAGFWLDNTAAYPRVNYCLVHCKRKVPLSGEKVQYVYWKTAGTFFDTSMYIRVAVRPKLERFDFMQGRSLNDIIRGQKKTCQRFQKSSM